MPYTQNKVFFPYRVLFFSLHGLHKKSFVLFSHIVSCIFFTPPALRYRGSCFITTVSGTSRGGGKRKEKKRDDYGTPNRPVYWGKEGVQSATPPAVRHLHTMLTNHGVLIHVHGSGYGEHLNDAAHASKTVEKVTLLAFFWREKNGSQKRHIRATVQVQARAISFPRLLTI